MSGKPLKAKRTSADGKSASSVAAAASDGDLMQGSAAGAADDGVQYDESRLLPIANTSRIMKSALPPNAKISKEAKEFVQKCVSEFISFITSEASQKCAREKRKTVNGSDLIWALSILGFDTYVRNLNVYLQNVRAEEEEIKAKKKAAPQQPGMGPQ